MSLHRRQHWRWVPLWAFAGVTLSACMGDAITVGNKPPPQEIPIWIPGSEEDPLKACREGLVAPGPSPLRRLTRFEYNNTVRDLMGTSLRPADTFPLDQQAMGFNNIAQVQSISQVHIEQWMESAEKLAAEAQVDTLAGCSGAAANADCAARFIERFGKKAWRRPLDSEERSRLQQLFATQSATNGFAYGIRRVVEALLQSPYFIYRPEVGAKGNELTSYERASRLSYFLWGSLPDDELFAAADADKLKTTEEVAAQARRMLKSPKARAMVAEFHRQWLLLDELDKAIKEDVYASFATLKPLMKRETELFLEEVFWNSGNASELFSAKYSYVNKALAQHYGVTGPNSDAFTKVSLDASQRSGFLTQAGFLSSWARASESSPIRRGVFVLKKFLCQEPPPPPPNAQINPPAANPNLTTRERYAEHRSSVACSGCHSLIDPIGFGLENYDAVGAYRTQENGHPVDASGTLTNSGNADGNYVGGVQLSEKLAQSDAVKHCISTQWFRYAYGRDETTTDGCNVGRIRQKFAASNYNLQELLVAITQTDAFMHRSESGVTP